MKSIEAQLAKLLSAPFEFGVCFYGRLDNIDKKLIDNLFKHYVQGIVQSICGKFENVIVSQRLLFVHQIVSNRGNDSG